jgi:hypothetical protein
MNTTRSGSGLSLCIYISEQCQQHYRTAMCSCVETLSDVSWRPRSPNPSWWTPSSPPPAPSSAARSGMCTPTSRRWSPSSAARASASVLYHKHGTFLHRALCLWGASDAVTWCSLFHSYSNSYVNLAIFDPGTNGPRLCALRRRRGRRAAFVHLLCVVPRKALMHDH